MAVPVTPCDPVTHITYDILLIHFQFTCLTCRPTAQFLMCTSSVLYETVYLRKSYALHLLDVVDVHVFVIN